MLVYTTIKLAISCIPQTGSILIKPKAKNEKELLVTTYCLFSTTTLIKTFTQGSLWQAHSFQTGQMLLLEHRILILAQDYGSYLVTLLNFGALLQSSGDFYPTYLTAHY